MLNVAERLITLILGFLLGFDLQTCLSILDAGCYAFQCQLCTNCNWIEDRRIVGSVAKIVDRYHAPRNGKVNFVCQHEEEKEKKTKTAQIYFSSFVCFSFFLYIYPLVVKCEEGLILISYSYIFGQLLYSVRSQEIRHIHCYSSSPKRSKLILLFTHIVKILKLFWHRRTHLLFTS